MTGALSAEVDLLVETELPARADTTEIADLVTFALAAEGASGRWSIAVVLTSDQRLRELHRAYMGLDSETDVMTFPADPEPGSETRGGDIVISVERAAANARDEGHETWDEVRFLAVHGVLHLRGWRDEDDEERARMLTRQAEIIERWSRRARD